MTAQVYGPRVRTGLVLAVLALLAGCSDSSGPDGAALDRPILFIGRVPRPDQPFIPPAIWSVRADGRGLRRVTGGLGEALFPAWSPDGRQVAFGTSVGGSSGGNGQVWLMNADGSNLRRASALPPCESTWGHLAWAPTGDRLIATCTSSTAIYDLTSGEVQPIAGGLASQAAWPAWSPDGGRIAFNKAFSDSVYVTGVEAGPVTALFADALEPAWSPDGNRLAFVGRDSGYTSIFVARVDGSVRTRLTRGGYDEGPAWSPDGRWIAFHRMGQLCNEPANPATCGPHWALYVVRSDGSGLRRLTPDSLQATRPTW